ncbi:sensor histidine kinase [Dokdonella sp.]|uniref:sensor histidine kinase n=1 Tax=Dokdonella sp. TaxID=2291710 RepID=UPI00352874C0
MKMRPASLRRHVTLAFALLGCVLSLLFATATIFITEHYEAVMAEGMINGLAQDLRDRHARDPENELPMPRSRLLQGYLRHADGSGNVPADFAELPLGIQEWETGEDLDIFVGVFDLAGDRLYLVIDMQEVETLELYLETVLAGIVVSGTAIVAWLVWILAGRTIAPVRRLAEAVEALPVRAERTHLAENMANDELGRLASAIDGYQARLVLSEDRERQFFADASHELRTPLSVVRGAAELLLEDEQLGNASRERLRRLDRGVETLTDLLDVMLRQARGISSSLEEVDTKAWLQESLADLTDRYQLSLHVEQSRLSLKPREGALVLRGLVRRLGRSEQACKLDVIAGANTITLRHAMGSNRKAESIQRDQSTDTQLGATLVGRLAANMGWSIDESQAESGQITLTIPPTGT